MDNKTKREILERLQNTLTALKLAARSLNLGDLKEAKTGIIDACVMISQATIEIQESV